MYVFIQGIAQDFPHGVVPGVPGIEPTDYPADIPWYVPPKRVNAVQGCGPGVFGLKYQGDARERATITLGFCQIMYVLSVDGKLL